MNDQNNKPTPPPPPPPAPDLTDACENCGIYIARVEGRHTGSGYLCRECAEEEDR